MSFAQLLLAELIDAASIRSSKVVSSRRDEDPGKTQWTMMCR